MFYYFSYKAALDDYTMALRIDPDKDHLKLKIAECYRLLNEPGQSEKWYSEVISNKTIIQPEHFLHYAQALSSNSKYSEAKKWYEIYQQAVQTDSRSLRKIEGINQLNDFLKDSLTFFVEPLNINSEASDFSPAFYPQGIVFISARGQQVGVKHVFSWNKTSFLDMYFSRESENGMNQKPELFHQNVNTRLHEGPTVFYDEGRKMIFTRNNLLNGKKGESKDNIVKLKLYYSEREGDIWSKPISLPFNNDDYSVGHPAISADGKTLYFVSDMPGGKGGTDIYVSNWQNGNWSEPVNIGGDVNTEGNEMFPSLTNRGQLYFASNGHGGLGGLDIYAYNLTTHHLFNLGAPLNTNFDDFGLIAYDDGLSGYFASNRKGGKGDDDLYHFRSRRELIDVIVYDKITGLEIENANANLIESETIVQGYLTDKEGEASFAVNPRKNYVVRIEKEGYLPSEAMVQSLDLQKDDLLRLRIPLEKLNTPRTMDSNTDTIKRVVDFTNTIANKISRLENPNEKAEKFIIVFQLQNVSGIVQELTRIADTTYLIDNSGKSLKSDSDITLISWDTPLSGEAEWRQQELKKYLSAKGYDVEFIQINNIYYDYDKHTIRNDASTDLDKVVALLEKHPDLKLELGSHTDSRGSDNYNSSLAKKRALAARNYLLNEGISNARISYSSFGEKKLVNDCGDEKKCDEVAHQSNRRTEFKVIFK